MSEQWWKSEEEREEVLELLSKSAKFTEVQEDILKNGQTSTSEFGTLPMKMLLNLDGTLSAAISYTSVNLALSMLGPENARHSVTYAKMVETFATDLDKMGIQTAEQVRNALPHIKKMSRYIIGSMPEKVESLAQNMSGAIQAEVPTIAMQKILGISKDVVGDTLDKLDI